MSDSNPIYNSHQLTTVTVVCNLPIHDSRREVKVQAQYFRIIDGALIFRNHDGGPYPRTVRMFAAGHWLEVITEEKPDAS